jgi:FkbM family methyltransferase
MLAVSFLRAKSSSYLLWTKNSFDRYYSKGYKARRSGRDTVVAFGSLELYLRRDSSDFMVFEQILEMCELKAVIELIQEKKINIHSILDCGANIGLASIYLSQQLPGVRILALEPEPDNYKQLEKNLIGNNLHQIRSRQVGVWSRKALLEHDVNFCRAKHWAFSVREAKNGDGNIAVDTIDAIINDFEMYPIDYLKMDIEGAEFELFRNLESWKRTFEGLKLISIEVHEKKGPTHEITEILQRHGFKTKKTGELVVGWRA